MKTWYAAIGLVLTACASSGSATDSGDSTDTTDAGLADVSEAGGSCIPRATQPCSCPDGTSGTQACSALGKWGACACGPSLDASVDVQSDAAPVCGDTICESSKGEDCVSCPTDCGQCKPCDYAPTCTGAASVPTTVTDLPSFDNMDQTSYSSTVPNAIPLMQTNCVAPQLKMAITGVQVILDGQSGPLNIGDGSADVFCAVTAQDAMNVQGAITQLFSGQKDHSPVRPVDALSGTFWGVPLVVAGTDGGKTTAPPLLSQSNIQIHYQCFRAESPDAVDKALSAIAGATAGISAIPGNPYGWAFGLGSAALQGILGAITGNGNHAWLDVIQNVSADALLDLTNGRTWKIHQSGNSDGHWEMELTVESWGCSILRPTGTH